MAERAVAAVSILPTSAAAAPRTKEAGMADTGIKASLERIFNGLIEVKVVTILNDVPVKVVTTDGRTAAEIGALPDEPVPALITIFNLIDGDVTNIIAPSLQDKADIRAFHTAQVERSLAVLPANIEALVRLGKAVLNELT